MPASARGAQCRRAQSSQHLHGLRGGDLNDFAFIAMEYVEGRSLRDCIDAGALPVDEAVRYGLDTADALAYAHEHGVVHRDFKAANAIVGATAG